MHATDLVQSSSCYKMTLILEHRQTLDQLIEGCRSGNRKAQELLYKQLASKMLGVCIRYSKDRYEAEDILQVAFVKMFEKIKDYKGEGSFEGWVRRIMVNTSIEFYRKSLRMFPVVDMEYAPEKAIEENQLSRLNMNDLLGLIKQLSPGYRVVFNMYAIEGYSHKEIAEQLNISEGTSKSQLARARAILQENILKMEGRKNEAYGG
jgi:RNA polymerase sigma factor (sigma-70 family)